MTPVIRQFLVKDIWGDGLEPIRGYRHYDWGRVHVGFAESDWLDEMRRPELKLAATFHLFNPYPGAAATIKSLASTLWNMPVDVWPLRIDAPTDLAAHLGEFQNVLGWKCEIKRDVLALTDPPGAYPGEPLTDLVSATRWSVRAPIPFPPCSERRGIECEVLDAMLARQAWDHHEDVVEGELQLGTDFWLAVRA